MKASVRVSLGNHDWKDKDVKLVTVSKITTHYLGIVDFDVAILTLSQKVQFNDRISPICLPAEGEGAMKDYSGRTGIEVSQGNFANFYNILKANNRHTALRIFAKPPLAL